MKQKKQAKNVEKGNPGINSLAELLKESLLSGNFSLATKKGYRTYFVNGKELFLMIQKTRIFLKNNNISKGDKIIIFGTNTISLITVYLASILSGIVVVPLDVSTNRSMLKKIQKQVSAKAIFLDRNLPVINIKSFYFEDYEHSLNKVLNIEVPEVKIKQDDLLEIVYTSGTTDESKGVILTHGNFVQAINSVTRSLSPAFNLKILNLLPLSHIFGQIYGLFIPIYFKHSVFFVESLKSSEIIRFIKRKRINCTILVPGILEALKKALSKKSLLFNLGIQFRFIGVGGAPLDPKLEKWWRYHLIAVIQGYGMTETASVISANTIFSSRVGSVGKITEGVSLDFSEDGEILVKGKNVTSGYYHDNKKTHESFVGTWFKTGDIGEVRNGFLYIKGRKKDVIIRSSGLKVYPSDIERMLNRINRVNDSCVIEKDGKVHAVLILEKGADIKRVVDKANNRLMSYQKITGYSSWPFSDFPRSATGKVKRFIVQNEINKLKSIKINYQNRLFTLLNDVLNPVVLIKADSKLSDLGMDSLKRVILISEIEKQFGANIDESDLNHRTRVSDLEKMICFNKSQKKLHENWFPGKTSNLFMLLLKHLIIYPYLFMFTRTEYHGLENIKNTPVILASNHQSAIDVPVILRKLKIKAAIAADSDFVFGIGTKGFFLRLVRKLKGILVRLVYNAYPFGASIGVRQSLEFTGELIDRGFSVLVFPEAHRTLDGKIKPFEQGIGYLAVNMGVPVIPIKISGLFDILPAGRFFPKFGKGIVKIGKPIVINNMSYTKATKLIEKKIREL